MNATSGIEPQPRWVGETNRSVTQGSRGAATLGFGTESPLGFSAGNVLTFRSFLRHSPKCPNSWAKKMNVRSFIWQTRRTPFDPPLGLHRCAGLRLDSASLAFMM